MNSSFGEGNFNRRVLLTGAGYSKNYGGFLASEIRNRLLSKPQVWANDWVMSMVQRHRGGFEEVMQMARERGIDSAEYQAIESAVYDVFTDMHDVQKRSTLRGINNKRVNQFLSKFCPLSQSMGYIFTLNQDLVLEQKFYNFYSTHQPVLPGVKSHHSYFSTNTGNFEVKEMTVTVNDDLSNIPALGCLNIVKLHGSFNWRTADYRLLVLGGNKEDAIKDSPLLLAYRNLFEQVLNAGDVRLFVIGYSFGDTHINKIIMQAVLNAGLTVWIMDRCSLDDMRMKIYNMHAQPIGDRIHGYFDEPFGEMFSPDDQDQTPWDDRIRAFFSD